MKEKELIEAMNSIDIPPEMKERLKAGLLQYQENQPEFPVKGERTMLKKKRIGGLVAVAVLTLSITAFAASGIVSTWYSSSSSRPDYRSLPTAEQVKKDIGYDVKLINQFSNGYVFKDGSINSNKLKNEDDQTIEKFKSVTFRYQKGKDEVDFTQDRYSARTENSGEVVASLDDVDIWYDSYVNKLVPPDYELTEEDKIAEENGDLVFSYGSEQVEIITWQSVHWQVGDMHYSLFQEVGEESLSQEELVAMVNEVFVE